MLAILLVSVLVALWLYSWVCGQYWRRLGVPYEFSLPLFGSRPWIYLLLETQFEYAERIYNKYLGARAIGLDTGARRELLIRDPALAKHIFVTNFNDYAERGMNNLPLKDIEPLRRHLLNTEGEAWRWLRRIQSPAFTPARIRAMFDLVSERAERLRTRVAELTTTAVDARQLMGHYTVDFISACGFGLDADTINNANNILYKLAAKSFRYHLTDVLIVLLKDMFPASLKKLKYLSRIESEMMALFKSVLKERNNKPSGRNDFMDLLLEIRNRQAENERDQALVLNDELLVAQLFLFFGAGFETSASTTSYTLHLLAQNPEAQDKARAEVLESLARHNGVFTYEAIKEMKYLTWAFREGMRIFPPAANIHRQVSKPCHLPGVGKLEQGLRIMVSARAFHRDPRYFPDPEKFRPERFDAANLTTEAKLAYMPFGVGPRSCLGEKLALPASVAGLAAVLAAARVAPAPGVPPPRAHRCSHLTQAVRDGLPLVFHSRPQ